MDKYNIHLTEKKEKIKVKKYKIKDIFKGENIKNKNKVVSVIKKKDN